MICNDRLIVLMYGDEGSSNSMELGIVFATFGFGGSSSRELTFVCIPRPHYIYYPQLFDIFYV